MDVLLAQQPTSRYPFRNPLPIPVEQFLHEEDAYGAWTAELDGRPMGHVAYTGTRDGFPGAADMNRTCAQAHACDIDRLAWISALFAVPRAAGSASAAACSAAVDHIAAPACIRASRCSGPSRRDVALPLRRMAGSDAIPS